MTASSEHESAVTVDSQEADSPWVPLCAAADVEAGCGTRVELAGQPPLAVFRLGDEFHVTADTCSHGNASLCDGFEENGEVECPWHAGKFNIRTGEATAFPATEPIRIYPARVRDGVVQAQVKPE